MRSGALAIAFLSATGARAQAITIVDGEHEREQLLGAFPQKVVDVADPTEGGRHRRLAGVEVARVLEGTATPAGADTLLVRCDDGWLTLVPLEFLRAHHPLLATTSVERSGPVPIDAPRGPVFLVWPDGGRSDLWSFSVHSLAYGRAETLYAVGAPTPDASPAVKHGWSVYRASCLHCHAAGGFGGMAAWDLTSPSIVKFRGADRVRAFILDAKRLVPEGHMPSFRGTLPARDIDDVVAYLGIW